MTALFLKTEALDVVARQISESAFQAPVESGDAAGTAPDRKAQQGPSLT